MRFVTILIRLQTTAVVHFRFGEVLLFVLTVSTTHVSSFALGECAEAHEDKHRRDDMTSRRLSEDI